MALNNEHEKNRIPVYLTSYLCTYEMVANSQLSNAQVVKHLELLNADSCQRYPVEGRCEAFGELLNAWSENP